MDQRQLQRLHMILKPFMLRRVKKDVEDEMPPKYELTLPCKLSETQRRIYKQLQKKIFFANAEAVAAGRGAAQKKSFLNTLSAPSAFSTADSAASDTLVTLVMQFRKVCNVREANTHTHTHARAHMGRSQNERRLNLQAHSLSRWSRCALLPAP